MFYTSAKKVLEAVKDKHEFVIVGAGNNGRQLAEYFLDHEMAPVAFFDNNSELWDKKLFGIPIMEPQKCQKDVIYILCLIPEYRETVYTQLVNLGIREGNILIHYIDREYDYMSKLEITDYPNEISSMFRERHGYDMCWENPQTYSEIINWEKVNVHDKRRSVLADKCAVRDWIKEKLGEQYLTKVYAVWDDPDHIEFNMLPSSFALKMNNANERNIIVPDKSVFDLDEAKKKISFWMSRSFAYNSLEMHYNDIKPKVYCEEYLCDAKDLIDYKIYCFQGEPKYVQRIRFEHSPESVARFYDMNWKPQEFNHYYVNGKEIIDRPEWLDEMISNTKILCSEFDHVRVDWFVLPNGKMYFGEMTFSSWSGLAKFIPEEADKMFGSMMK